MFSMPWPFAGASQAIAAMTSASFPLPAGFSAAGLSASAVILVSESAWAATAGSSGVAGCSSGFAGSLATVSDTASAAIGGASADTSTGASARISLSGSGAEGEVIAGVSARWAGRLQSPRMPLPDSRLPPREEPQARPLFAAAGRQSMRPQPQSRRFLPE